MKWYFDSSNKTIRAEVSSLTSKEIEETEDESIIEAVFIPNSSKRARKIFMFLIKNSNLITSIPSMGAIVTGIDRYKLSELAKGYGLDLFKYMTFVDMFEDYLVKDINNSLKNK